MDGASGAGYRLVPGGHVGNVVVLVAALPGAEADAVELEEVVAPTGDQLGLGVDVLAGARLGEVELVRAVPAVGGAQVVVHDVGGGAAVGVPDRCLAVAVRPLLQAGREIDAGLEALGVDAVGDGLHAVGEADRVGLLAAVLVESGLPGLVHPPAGVDVDVLVAVLLQLGGHGVGLLQDVGLGEVAVVAVRVEAGVLGRLHAPTGPAHVGLGGEGRRGGVGGVGRGDGDRRESEHQQGSGGQGEVRG